MKEYKDPILPILISFAVCFLVLNIGIIYHELANSIYHFALEILPQANLPKPQIQESIIKMIILELFSSPFEVLQTLKGFFNLSSIHSQSEPLKYIQLIIEILSLVNLYVSWYYGTYILSRFVIISLLLAYFQIEVLLLNYLLNLILSLFDNVFIYTFSVCLFLSIKTFPITAIKIKTKQNK